MTVTIDFLACRTYEEVCIKLIKYLKYIPLCGIAYLCLLEVSGVSASDLCVETLTPPLFLHHKTDFRVG